MMHRSAHKNVWIRINTLPRGSPCINLINRSTTINYYFSHDFQIFYLIKKKIRFTEINSFLKNKSTIHQNFHATQANVARLATKSLAGGFSLFVNRAYLE